MTATLTTTPTTTTTAPAGTPPAAPSVWRTGLRAGVAAAVATTAVAAAARAADVPLAVDGEAIPLAGFAQLTLLFTAVGVLLARAIARRAARPRHTLVVTTVVLTALSCLPDAVIGATAATKLVLVLAHLVAAAIVIPALARRMPEASRREA